MITNIFSAVAGVIAEPVVGALEGGIAGGAVGLGRGILGLVCKPVKGTIDLVCKTTQGLQNTPRTMYIGFNRLIKRAPKDQNPNEPSGLESSIRNFNAEDHVILGEDEGQVIYISK